MKKLLIGSLIAASLGAASVAPAATKTTTFQVTATVVANCFINSASTLAFGNYTPGAGVVDQNSSIVVRCSNGTAYGIGLSTGSGTLAQRTMTSGTVAGTVNYNLYTTAGRTQVWENPANAAAVVNNQGGTGTGLGNTFTHTVYGRLQDDATSQLATPANDYADTITVTINY